MATQTTTQTAHSGRSTPGRWLDPSVLARIGNLELLARFVVDGFLSGLHKTNLLGSSTEFAEYRPYVPGDDVRKIDWRVFARSDRLYIKAFEAETNADIVIAIDTSASMGYSSHDISKLDYAKYIAASIAHLASSQRDRVGLALFNDAIIERLPASSRQRQALLSTLNRAEPAGASNLADSLKQLAQTLKRRGIVIVLSDFYTDADEVALALDEFRVRGHDVVAMHVLDPKELDLDLPNIRVLEDMESGDKIAVSTSKSRRQYQQLITDHLQALREACGKRRTEYTQFDTSKPLDTALYSYLSQRARWNKAKRS